MDMQGADKKAASDMITRTKLDSEAQDPTFFRLYWAHTPCVTLRACVAMTVCKGHTVETRRACHCVRLHNDTVTRKVAQSHSHTLCVCDYV